MARKFLDPNSIFQIEVNLISGKFHRSWHLNIQVEEGLDKVKVSIRNLKEFKTCFLVGTMPAPKLNPTLSLSGIQDSSALLLHRPGEARPLLGVPRAARVQALWLLCWETPHDAWVLLHSSAGAECFRKKITFLPSKSSWSWRKWRLVGSVGKPWQATLARFTRSSR